MFFRTWRPDFEQEGAEGVVEGNQGYDRGGIPIFTDVFKPVARVALYPTDENGLGTCFGTA